MIHIAQRNALILRWWSACSDGFKVAACANYSLVTGIPDCELGTMDEWAQDPDTLIWLAQTYPYTLEAFANDQL